MSTTGSTSSTSSVSIDSINNLIGAGNSNRVSGLASGIDIDSIVAKMMTAESQPLVQMQQNLQLMQWQRDDYRSMNTLLSTLQTNVQTMDLQGTFLAKTVTSSDPNTVTATAGATSGNATYTLSNITMATSAYNNSQNAIGNSNFDPNKSMWDMKSNLNNSFTWNQVGVSGESQTTTATGTTFQLQHTGIDTDPAKAPSIKVNNADYTVVADKSLLDPAQNQVFVDHSTGQLTFSHSINSGATIASSYTYDNISFSVATVGQDGTATSQPFTFDSTASLNTILSTISQSTVGVSTFYDSSNNRVSMTRTETGNLNASGAEMQFSGASADFMTSALQIDTTKEQGGTDATYNVNGLPSLSTSHSNTVTFGGVSATLQANNVGPVTLRVNTDTDTVYKSISNFIDTYNTTIAGINSKISETRNYSYLPLTDAQKQSMKDTDITAWTTKAQSGMLANDSILSGALSQMRINLSNPVSGTSDSTMSQLAAIGITTSSNYLDNGKLVISDSAKLNQAISTNPQAVMELFTNTGTSSTDTASQGIMQRLNTTITNTITQIEQQAGNTNMTDTQYFIGQNIDNLNTQISDFKTKLVSIENRYYSQFTAMEQAIQQANTQSSYIQNLMK